MNILFAKHILSVPTFSGKEDFFADCIEKWCKITGIQVSRDGKGNLYLRKGAVDGKDFVPCLCSHLDTVHRKYIPYIEKKQLLPVRQEGDRFSIDGMGVGADCKAGVAICLSVMRKVSKCKCVLFVEEELGMLGSKSLDKSFFDNVSYVLSWDSPGGNRATKTSAGVPMFTDEFFEVFSPIYKRHGVTNWKNEPYTDTVQIVKQTGVACINAKNGGGMNCHTDKEDCSFKDMDDSEQLCLDAIAEIPCDRKWEVKYEEPKASPYSAYSYYSPYLAGAAAAHKPSSTFGSLPPLGAGKFEGTTGASELTMAQIEQHDGGDLCEFTFTYDDEPQYKKHLELLKKEDVAVEMDEFDPMTSTAGAFGELFEMKLAYILWYQLFYDAPDIKTWKQLAAEDDLTDFADNIVFADDLDAGEDDYIDVDSSGF